MRKLNKKLPYGTIHGIHENFPGARFSVGHALFDVAGNCLSEDGVKPYVPSAEPDQVDDSPETETAKAQESLAAMSDDVAEKTDALKAAETDLQKAKDADINDADYTANVTAAQKAVTSAKRALTKAINLAAVTETAMNSED